MMNPNMLLKMRNAMNTFNANHPKFTAFFRYAMSGGVPEGTIIEVTITKPGEAPVTTNLRILQEDLDLMESLKEMQQ